MRTLRGVGPLTLRERQAAAVLGAGALVTVLLQHVSRANAPWMVPLLVLGALPTLSLPIRQYTSFVWQFLPPAASCAIVLLADPVPADSAPLFLLQSVTLSTLTAGPTPGLLGLATSWGVLAVAQATTTFDSAALWAAGTLLSWLFSRTVLALGESMRQLEIAQEGLAAAAAARERQRIAREMHDVAAHTLAVTMLHLNGAMLALDGGDVDQARDALALSVGLGRESMEGLRRMVSILHDRSLEEAEDAHRPGWEALVDEYQSAGMPLDADLDPRLDELPSLVAGSLQRILREALANAARHAPGCSVRAHLRVGPAGTRADLRVETRGIAIDRQPAPTRPGLGLAGMRSRSDAIAAHLQVSRTHDAFVVEVIWPSSAIDEAQRPGGVAG